mmetsp:Transcript_19737/g.19492  ORF Transcript_19737/g.19492 Transcript_19737/m.19492 type:complete len:122 (-) Transcript_19737:103-468(-)
MLAEMSQKWSKSDAVTATPDHEEEEAVEKAEYLGRMIRPDALHHATSNARADDGRPLLVAANSVEDDANTVTSLPHNANNNDDDNTSSTENHILDTMQLADREETILTMDRTPAAAAIIAL